MNPHVKRAPSWNVAPRQYLEASQREWLHDTTANPRGLWGIPTFQRNALSDSRKRWELFVCLDTDCVHGLVTVA